jgi:predicted aldo/keto reductase-like oxidoreductase
MRLPRTEDDKIDEAEAERMVKYAIENGVNYFDTAYDYHNGESERFLGRILKDGWREKVRLVTKLPCWHVNEERDFDRLFNEQLEKLQTDHLDAYLLHALNKGSWEKVYRVGVLDWLRKLKSSQRVGAVGFSFHDNFEVFKAILDANDWDVCQIQYNYMNETEQAGTHGLKYAASLGVGVVIMEPLLGGKLATPPGVVRKIWETGTRSISPSEWALQWLWSKPEVSIVLSGMSAMEQVVENVCSASRSGLDNLTKDELDLVERVRVAYEATIPIPCTACEYCLPCPNGVLIPMNFNIFNKGIMYGDIIGARREYEWLGKRKGENALAEACQQCDDCETKCPQKILVSQWMPYVHDVLGRGKAYDPTVTF